MTITYYAVVEGDPLDNGNGGRVLYGSNYSTIEDDEGRARRQTYLGHKAFCGVCKTDGPILAGVPIETSLRGFDTRENAWEAVGGDIVICKCEPHPRVTSVYGRSVMYIDTGSANSWTGANNRAASPAANTTHWIKFRLSERDSCEGLQCAAHFADGSSEYGTFDANNAVRFERANNGNACTCIELIFDENTRAFGSVAESILSAIVG